MIMPGTAYETSSGGPFMRDINSQSGDDQELYVYWNSGHVRTEPWRFGLMGPYGMKFTFVVPPFLPARRTDSWQNGSQAFRGP